MLLVGDFTEWQQKAIVMEKGRDGVWTATLKLPRGKLAAQVAHAAVNAFLAARSEAQRAWLTEGMPKVVLHGESADLLRTLEQRARDAALPVALIADAGHTVVEPGTITCLAIGPAASESIDRLTGELRLLK